METQARVLIIDDDADIRDSLSEYFDIHGFNLTSSGQIEGTLDLFLKDRHDLIILDINLPDGNGFNLARDIRSHSKVPIIFLSGRESEEDRLAGFELGGDDYVVKPFSPKELVYRVKALLRRTNHLNDEDLLKANWQFGEHSLHLDEEGHHISQDGKEIILTSSEWKILTHLVFSEETVISREQILSRCLEYTFEGYDRTVDTHIKNIRAKLGHPGWIETVRGYGYRFVGERIE